MSAPVLDHAPSAGASVAAESSAGVSRKPVVVLTLAAIALRLLVFLGRGDYVAFDEGWYLLLGSNLISGNGYMLSGLQHVALSPLFPAIAGIVDVIVGNTVWSGRIVAAVAGGLLVVPCWSIFSRIGGTRVAIAGCILIACVPTLTPFAAAYWIGWDLWVGAEPLFHLALLGGFALTLRAIDAPGHVRWGVAGGVFALAYLARPEAIVAVAVLCSMLALTGLMKLDIRRLSHVALVALGFATVAAPYWLYLHDALGRWTITGRSVAMPSVSLNSTTPRSSSRPSIAIETMLWGESEGHYRDALYGLDATRTRLRSPYWGIDTARAVSSASSLTDSAGSTVPVVQTSTDGSNANSPPPGLAPSRTRLYGRALGVAVPWLLWPLVAIGLIGRRLKLSSELLMGVPVAVTSIVIAAVVAADPRTQLLVVPVAAYYAARGIVTIGTWFDHAASSTVRPGFARATMLSIIIMLFLVTETRWVYLGQTLGSPHHLVGSANRTVARALDGFVPPEAAVMSWHPALALYANRDWRVLPSATMPDLVRYANAIGSEYAILSVYYPSPVPIEQMPSEYLVLHIPPGLAGTNGGWQLEVSQQNKLLTTARLRSAR